jgi:hypothetical protein
MAQVRGGVLAYLTWNTAIRQKFLDAGKKRALQLGLFFRELGAFVFEKANWFSDRARKTSRQGA